MTLIHSPRNLRPLLREPSVDPSAEPVALTPVIRLLPALLLLALLATFASAVPASAMTLEMSVEKMSAMAPRVVLAEVQSMTARATEGADIETAARLRVLETLKGEHEDSVTLTYPGGTVGDVTVLVPDTPQLAPGQQVLVFIDFDGRPVGWSQGVLRVQRGVVPAQRQTLRHVRQRVASAAALPPSAIEDGPSLGVTSLESASPQSAGPVIASVSPGKASAGTGSAVKIKGSGFGSSAGGVEFFFRSGQPTIRGAVRSWSDSEVVVEVPVGYVTMTTSSGTYSYPGSASSGPLVLRTASGTTASADFDVSFGFGGNRWESESVGFRVNPNGPVSNTSTMVRAAADTWSLESALALRYEGTTSVTTPKSGDGLNTVSWAPLTSGLLGQASMRFSSGKMIEADFVFNSSYASWGDGTNDTIDVQSVALHELGHWFDLRDLYGSDDRGKVMYGAIGKNTRKRAPTADDAAGVRWIYGEAAAVPVIRVAGADRYATAIEISKRNFGAASTVVLATGADFPDALSASGLAGSYNAPLLLTRPDHLPSSVRTEIARLGAEHVIVVGGKPAVSDNVVASLDAMDGVSVERIAGRDRYSTAAAIAHRLASREGPRPEAFLVRGDTFPDALAVAPFAYSRKAPVLLASPTGLPAATLGALDTTSALQVIIAGSAEAVPNSVVSALSSSVRISGYDRYDTAARVVAHAVAAGWTTPRELAVATGLDFPDALGGGAAMGANGGAILLTPPTRLSSTTERALSARKADLERVQVLGSGDAVSSDVARSISLALR